MKTAAALLLATLGTCAYVGYHAVQSCPGTATVITYGPARALQQGQTIKLECHLGHWRLASGLNADLVRNAPSSSHTNYGWLVSAVPFI